MPVSSISICTWAGVCRSGSKWFSDSYRGGSEYSPPHPHPHPHTSTPITIRRGRGSPAEHAEMDAVFEGVRYCREFNPYADYHPHESEVSPLVAGGGMGSG